MRQIHQLVSEPADHQQPVSVQTPASALSDQTVEQSAATSVRPPDPQHEVPESRPRGGRPASATVEELAEIGRITAAEQGKLTRAIVRKGIEDKGHTVSSKRLTEVMDILRPDFEPELGAEAGTGPDSS